MAKSVLYMSVSMDGFADRPDRTIVWLTASAAATTPTNAIASR